MDESFYYTNIVPQDLDNNSGFWNRLEMYCRELARRFDDVHVISGPLYMPHAEPDGRRYVKYQAGSALGAGHVSGGGGSGAAGIG